MYVSNDQMLRELITRLRKSPVVGVDTEFMREKTYFAKLCLVQLASEHETALVDPLAISDMTPLCDLLGDPSVVKVLHAGSQDLEIFYGMCGHVTGPVFDTQVAATLAGFPHQVGYGGLVRELLGVEVDKGDTYTDWSRRPLTDTQIVYARNDVLHLPEIYRRLKDRLDAEGRSEWLASTFKNMEDPATYEVDFNELWRKVKRVSSLNRRGLAVAREVAAWREHEAMRRDIPKRWVLGDESVVEVARRAPQTPSELRAVRGVGDKLGKGSVEGLLSAVARGTALPEADLPALKRRRRTVGDVDATVDLMVALQRKRAHENDVAMPLLASHKDLERLASGEREGNPVYEGWRKTMLGDELIDLLEGRLSLSLHDGELVVSRVEPDESGNE